MTRDLYWTACTVAGPWRRGHRPRGVNLRSAAPKFPLVRKAVYVVCDSTGTVAYVGKVTRASDSLAVAARVREHVIEPTKATTWSHLYVVPLRVDTPGVVVDYVEASLIELLEPYQNRLHPSATRLASLAQAYMSSAAADE
jgi:hypothetical protein